MSTETINYSHHLSDADYKRQKRAVWQVTAILAVVTVVEVGCAVYGYDHNWPRVVLNLLFILMSIIKAFFIVGEFMHLRYELRALIISILAPCFFLIWFIIAFMMEGHSWLAMRTFWGY